MWCRDDSKALLGAVFAFPRRRTSAAAPDGPRTRRDGQRDERAGGVRKVGDEKAYGKISEVESPPCGSSATLRT